MTTCWARDTAEGIRSLTVIKFDLLEMSAVFNILNLQIDENSCGMENLHGY